MERIVAVLSLSLICATAPNVLFAALDFADGETGSRIVQKDDTAAVFEIPLSGDEAWTATTDVPSTDGGWINLRRKQGTDCSRPATYKVLHNYSTDARIGHIYVNGLTYTVTQLGYGAELAPSGNISIPASGSIAEGQISFAIEPATDGAKEIAWTAASDSDWVVVRPSRGDGDSVVYYSVSENALESERVATLTIAGRQITITQSGAEVVDPNANKVWLVPETAITWPCPAKEFDVSLITGDDVGWTAASDADWIVITTSKTGTGNSTLHVSLPENRSVLSRSGKITVNSTELTVIQRGTTDFALSLDPETSAFPYGGAISNVAVTASQDMSWAAKSSMPWVRITSGASGAGSGEVKYVVSANPTLTNRTAEIEVSAQIPYPEIDIARGLTQWKGENWLKWTAFNDPAVRDAEVQGCTEGVWFHVTETNALNRLFDLNNGVASLYVQEFQNRLVYDAPDGSIVDLGFTVATNVTYDIFLVTTPTATSFFGGIHDSGVYRHLYTDNRSLRITNYKHTTKPSEDWLVKGDASTQAYYFWNRPLTATELLNFPFEAPRIPASAGDVYSTLYSHAPMDRFRVRKADGTEETLAVSNVIVTTGRERLNHSGLSGSEIQPLHQLGVVAYFEYARYKSGVYTYEDYHAAADEKKVELVSNIGSTKESLYTKWDNYYYLTAVWSWGINVNDVFLSNKCSWNFWIKSDGLSDVQMPLFYALRTKAVRRTRSPYSSYDAAQLDKGNEAYLLQVSSNGFSFVENSVKSADFGGDKLQQGKWHMLTVTSNGSKMTMYLDGEDIGTMALAGGYDYFCLDSWCAYGNGGKIVFDDIKTFTSCLTTDQINEIYNLEKPLKRTLTITQGIAPVTLSETTLECPSRGDTRTIAVTLPARNIQWCAESQVDWIVPSPASGTGSAEVVLTIAKNPETSDRIGTVVIAGVPVAIHQRRAGISVPHDVIFADYDGETMFVPIAADDDDTHWIVEDYPDDWMYVIDEDGYGNMDMEFDVDEMGQGVSLSARVGVVTVSGQKFYVVQRDFVPGVEPQEINAKWNTAGGTIQVSTEDGIEYWEAVADSDWITIAQGENGMGDGSVTYTLVENDTGRDRTGRIIIAGEVCTITQKCPPVLTGFEITGVESFFASDTANYSAQLVYSDGTVVPADSVAWSVSDSTVAAVDAQGAVAAGNAAGNIVLSASCTAESKIWTASREIEIKAKPVGLEIEVSQDLICPGWTVEVVFTVTYADGTTKRVLPTAFVEGDATLDADGFLTIGTTAGEVRVFARYSENDSGLLGADETFHVREPITVNEALGDNSLSYASGGDSPWDIDPWHAHDQTFSMKSGMIQANQTSDLKTVVDGVGTLSFWVRTSTAENPADAAFQLIVDGAMVVELSGQTDWTNIVHEITTYDFHDIVWRYTKGAFHGHENEDAVWIDEVQWIAGAPDPLPRVSGDSDVDDALSGSSDVNLSANINTAFDYNAYRAWVNRKGFAHQAAKDAPRSWLSYLLDAPTMIDKRLKKDDMSIGPFTLDSLGRFAFEIGVNDIEIGEGATAENLAKVFGVEGATSLDGAGFSPDNVQFAFGVPKDGKVPVVAVPKDEAAKSFFVRATMRDFYDDIPVVSLKLNGGGSLNGASDEILVDRDAEYGSLPTPTRTGHTFDGWYTAPSGGTKVTGSTTIASNSSHPLYAHWTPNTYTITFDPNDGSVSPTSKTVTYGASYGDMPTPTCGSYRFDGWFTAPSGGIKISDASTFLGVTNITIYAHWTCLITLDANGGDVSPSTIIFDYGAECGELPIPTRLNYAFTGWYNDCGKEVVETNIIIQTQTFHAQWIKCEYMVDNGAATLTKWHENDTDTYVPSKLDGYSVVGIGNGAFDDCRNLITINIPDSITNIEINTFLNSPNFRAFYVSPSNSYYKAEGGLLLTKDGTTLLAVPKGLTSLDIPSTVKDIGQLAVANCEALINVTIPNSVTNIGLQAFYYCSSITNILIPNSVERIGVCAFEDCGSLKNVIIPSSVTAIGFGAFYNCKCLTSVTIPTSVMSIGKYAFEGCRNVREVTVPGWQCEIPFNNVTNLVISAGTTSIRWYAFENCSSIKSVTIPDSVTSIGEYAFSSCRGLASVTIPDSVTSIGKSAFDGTLFYSNQPSGLLVFGKVAYKIKGTCPAVIAIPDGVTSIGSEAFYNCTGLTGVTIPNSVTDIGSSAFKGCRGLMGLTLPDGLTAIGDSAFAGCFGLTTVNIPSRVTSIGEYAFSSCSGITSITIPNSVTSIGKYAFDGCRNIREATVPGWQCEIPFNNVTNLVISAGTPSIRWHAFENCSSIKSVAIPDSVTNIGYCAFLGCSGLTNVNIPSIVTSIEDSAFSDCTNLKKAYVPYALEMQIETNSVFSGCDPSLAIIYY